MSEEQTNATKEFTTKNGHVIVYKAELKGRDTRQIRNKIVAGTKVEARLGEPASASFNEDSMLKWEDASISVLIISVDGKTEDIVNLVLDLPSDDYNQVFRIVNEATQPIDADAKKE